MQSPNIAASKSALLTGAASGAKGKLFVLDSTIVLVAPAAIAAAELKPAGVLTCLGRGGNGRRYPDA